MLRSCSALSGVLLPLLDALLSASSAYIIRYDAHPMAILTSSFAAIGSYYSEVRQL